jgi:hypothetical protein
MNGHEMMGMRRPGGRVHAGADLGQHSARCLPQGIDSRSATTLASTSRLRSRAAAMRTRRKRNCAARSVATALAVRQQVGGATFLAPPRSAQAAQQVPGSRPQLGSITS